MKHYKVGPVVGCDQVAPSYLIELPFSYLSSNFINHGIERVLTLLTHTQLSLANLATHQFVGICKQRAMARSQTPQGSLRQRNVPKKDADVSAIAIATSDSNPNVDEKLPQLVTRHVSRDKERDYKLVLLIITLLAFVTRFWGISHPNEVVFDEVHFGKVRPPS